MKTILFSVLFMSITAQAHIQSGLYKGLTADGQACEITVGANYYLNNQDHPLNERIDITLNGDLYAVQHPPVIDEASSTAFFNHDAFHGILPTSKGGKALIVHMAHTADYEGPVSFTSINHEWKSGTKTSVTCLDIKKQ